MRGILASGLVVSALIGMYGGALWAQRSSETPAATAHPMLAGTWTPSDPAVRDSLFAVGLADIPGSGRLTIEQRADRFAVTTTIPEEQLDPFLKFYGRFYPTVIYPLDESRGRVGGTGAGGTLPPTVPTWVGDRLVIPETRPAMRPTTTTMTTTYSLEGDRLKREIHAELVNGRVSNAIEWFTKVK